MKLSTIENRVKDTQVEVFISKLNSRRRLINYKLALEESLKDINQQKLDLGSPKSPALDKVGTASIGSSTNSTELSLLKLLTKENEIAKELKDIESELLTIDNIIEVLEVTDKECYDICKFRFVENHSWFDAEEKFCMSRRGLDKKLKKAIKRYVK